MPLPLLESDPGSGGYDFEADLQGTTYIPKSKLVYGPDGTKTDVSTGTPWPIQLRNTSGTEIGTNANPVQVGDGGSSLTVDGSVNVGTVTTITNVVHVDDNAGSLTVDGTVSVSGTVTSSETKAGTATRTDVSGSATSVTLHTANGSRLGIRICNDSTVVLYLLEGSGTASSSNFTTKLYTDELYTTNDYTGQINGAWASATGSARVTELTA